MRNILKNINRLSQKLDVVVDPYYAKIYAFICACTWPARQLLVKFSESTRDKIWAFSQYRLLPVSFFFSAFLFFVEYALIQPSFGVRDNAPVFIIASALIFIAIGQYVSLACRILDKASRDNAMKVEFDGKSKQWRAVLLRRFYADQRLSASLRPRDFLLEMRSLNALKSAEEFNVERIIFSALSKTGELLKFGETDIRDVGFTTYNIPVHDEEQWLPIVMNNVAKADEVICVPFVDSDSALVSELSEIMRLGMQSKLVFVMPPEQTLVVENTPGTKIVRHVSKIWEDARVQLSGLGLNLPKHKKYGGVIRMNDGKWILKTWFAGRPWFTPAGSNLAFNEIDHLTAKKQFLRNFCVDFLWYWIVFIVCTICALFVSIFFDAFYNFMALRLGFKEADITVRFAIVASALIVSLDIGRQYAASVTGVVSVGVSIFLMSLSALIIAVFCAIQIWGEFELITSVLLLFPLQLLFGLACGRTILWIRSASSSGEMEFSH